MLWNYQSPADVDTVVVHAYRWRRLPGKVPGKDELRARISYLLERLDKKEDTLLEKRLILEEIASLSHRLRTQAAEGREDTLELAQKVAAVMQQSIHCIAKAV